MWFWVIEFMGKFVKSVVVIRFLVVDLRESGIYFFDCKYLI